MLGGGGGGRGKGKISHFNARHVYIELENESDYVTVWTN